MNERTKKVVEAVDALNDALGELCARDFLPVTVADRPVAQRHAERIFAMFDELEAFQADARFLWGSRDEVSSQNKPEPTAPAIGQHWSRRIEPIGQEAARIQVVEIKRIEDDGKLWITSVSDMPEPLAYDKKGLALFSVRYDCLADLVEQYPMRPRDAVKTWQELAEADERARNEERRQNVRDRAHARAVEHRMRENEDEPTQETE